MIDAEEEYNNILEDNQKLLDERNKREEDKTAIEKKLEQQVTKIADIESKLADARIRATQITDEEKLAILRQEAAVERLTEVEEKSELQKQELIVAKKKLHELEQQAIGDNREVEQILRELEKAERDQIDLLKDLERAQEDLNDATKEYNDATAKTPANLLRIADAKQRLDDAIADVKALDNFKGALDQIIEDTGAGLGQLYLDLMKIMNVDPNSPFVPSTSSTSNSSTEDGIADGVKDGTEEAFKKLTTPSEETATSRILSDSRFVGGGSGVTTLINLKNEFNIEGALNSDEVAIKVIEAQKRGLNVVL